MSTYTENKVKSAYGFIQNDTWGGVGTAADIPDDIFYEINIPEAFKGMEGAISARTVTYDFERLMDDATLLKCSEFGDAIISHM